MVIIFVMKTNLSAGLIAELNLIFGVFASELDVSLTHFVRLMYGPLYVPFSHILVGIIQIFACVTPVSPHVTWGYASKNCSVE
jgi:hypothetical protein